MEREPPRREYAAMKYQPLWLLLLRIRRGKIGRWKQIWKVVAAKAEPSEANATLLQFLESSAPYLDRYWCAAALISLNQLERGSWRPVDLSAWRYRDEVAKVRSYLERQALGVTPNELPQPGARLR